MKHCIRSQQYKILGIAKPFSKLPSGPISKNPPNIMDFCFKKLIDTTDEGDNFFENLVKSVPEIISKELMSASEIYQILQKSVNDLMMSNVLLLGKVSKLFAMIESILDSNLSTMDKELLREIDNCALGMNVFTTMFTNKKTSKHMLEIRRKCKNINDKIATEIQSPPHFSESPEALEKLKELSLYEIGLVYTRVPEMREKIKTFLKNPSNQGEIEYGELQSFVIKWVLNSEPEQEWKGVMEFITEVLLTTYGTLPNLNPVELFNNTLHVANKISFKEDSPSIIRQYMKFYKTGILNCWERESFSKKDQFIIMETFVMLTLKLFDTMKKRRSSKERIADDSSIQQVLLVMLELLNLIVVKNTDFVETMMEPLLDIVILLPHVKGKCEPIRKCILDRIVKQQRNRMMPLPDVVETSRQAVQNLSLLENQQSTAAISEPSLNA